MLDVAVTAESVANIHITNVYAAMPNGVKVKVSDAEVNLTTTGIQQVGVEIAPTLFYDLTGRQLNGVPTRPGIYISNGKKVVIK